MEIQKIDINKLIPATYNPRKDLKPNDKLLMGLITSLSLKNGYCSISIVHAMISHSEQQIIL